MEPGKSLREHGMRIGTLEAGASNSIADVGELRVGHVTVVRDEPDPPEGRGVARTGITAIVPGPVDRMFREPLQAGMAVLNGAGELTGSHEIAEWGWLASPVYLTATMAVGRVYDGAVGAAVAADPAMGVDEVTIPVVGECDDSWLSDARVVQVEGSDVPRAVEAARPAFAQGAVGAGAGMVCFGWKGGIGSSSRVTADGHVVGALVLANFGEAPELRIDGVPIGVHLAPGAQASRGPAGSCIAVIATDARISSSQLTRVARRAGLGLARTGSVAHDGSGEIFLAFSTTARSGRNDPPPASAVSNSSLDALFTAAVDATEEAVVNCLWAAETTTGREGRVIEALPHEPVLDLLATHRRLTG